MDKITIINFAFLLYLVGWSIIVERRFWAKNHIEKHVIADLERLKRNVITHDKELKELSLRVQNTLQVIGKM